MSQPISNKRQFENIVYFTRSNYYVPSKKEIQSLYTILRRYIREYGNEYGIYYKFNLKSDNGVFVLSKIVEYLRGDIIVKKGRFMVVFIPDMFNPKLNLV